MTLQQTGITAVIVKIITTVDYLKCSQSSFLIILTLWVLVTHICSLTRVSVHPTGHDICSSLHLYRSHCHLVPGHQHVQSCPDYICLSICYEDTYILSSHEDIILTVFSVVRTDVVFNAPCTREVTDGAVCTSESRSEVLSWCWYAHIGLWHHIRDVLTRGPTIKSIVSWKQNPIKCLIFSVILHTLKWTELTPLAWASWAPFNSTYDDTQLILHTHGLLLWYSIICVTSRQTADSTGPTLCLTIEKALFIWFESRFIDVALPLNKTQNWHWWISPP